MKADDSTPFAVLVSNDFLFTSKITGTASQLGRRVQPVGSVSNAAESASRPECRLVILDLGGDYDPSELTTALPAEDAPPVVAFGSHVDAARLQSARDAGCAEVMPRSRFSETLPEILSRYLKGD